MTVVTKKQKCELSEYDPTLYNFWHQRGRTTAEERERNPHGDASAPSETHSQGVLGTEVIHIYLLVPDACSPLLIGCGGWIHQPLTEEPEERIVTHILVHTQCLGEAASVVSNILLGGTVSFNHWNPGFTEL